MTIESGVTCFVDIKGYTPTLERLGQEAMKPILDDFERVGRVFTEICGGDYIKGGGDSHIVLFHATDSALRFSAVLQEYYVKKPCLNRPDTKIRVALARGSIERTKGDIKGQGVNLASRIEGVTPEDQVWVNDPILSELGDVLGPAKAKVLFCDEGDTELKGITDPPKQKLFSFDWSNYLLNDPEKSLSNIIFGHLQNASVIASNLTVSDLSKPSVAIWPVVPRDYVNAIHRGQIEILRLLSLVGWKIIVLIEDCGVQEGSPRAYSEKFKAEILKYVEKRNLNNLEYYLMSDLYAPGSKNCNRLHLHFQHILSNLKLNDLIEINKKDYPKAVQDLIQYYPTLDFIRLALTIASVLHILGDPPQKGVVVVGHDEQIQWGSSFEIPENPARFGVLFNPLLLMNEGHQRKQTKNWPQWFSWEDILKEMKQSNLSTWTLKLHAFLPQFPLSQVEINERIFSPGDWLKPTYIFPEDCMEPLAKLVYHSILSL